MASKSQIANSWLPVALERIRAEMMRLKVQDSGSLIGSLQGKIQEISNGDQYKVELLYNFYGIFPDMGVGRGQAMGDQVVAKLLGQKGRKKKNWTKEIVRQRYALVNMLQGAYADEAKEAVTGSLRTKVVMNI